MTGHLTFVKTYFERAISPCSDEFWKKSFNLQWENFAKARQKKLKIALGTDAGEGDWKKVNQAKEFEYYVQYGMTPMQAIRTGTSVAAELLGWSETAGINPARLSLAVFCRSQT